MFHEVNPLELSCNPFQMIGKDWALVTAGDETGCNTMTVSWGNMGIMWNKNIVTVFIRPQRYTHDFLEKTDHFTLSFYDGMRDALTLCGRTSGRDGDKIAAAGLHLAGEEEYPWFAESKLVFCCNILYRSAFDPAKMADGIDEKNYPAQDYHDVYVAEIVKTLEKAD